MRCGEVVQITAIIKAKNEEKQIGDAVRSALLLAGKVFVIDDHSSDRTVEEASRAGAIVLPGPEHGGRIDLLDKFGFEHVPSGWILKLDADERITQPLADHLRSIATSGRFEGVRYRRRHIMFGRSIIGGGWDEPMHVGFFSVNGWDREWPAKLHTQVPISGPVETVVDSEIYSEHHDYQQVRQFIARSLLGYAIDEGRQMHEDGVRFRPVMLTWDPVKKLLGRFLIRGGWRDGLHGLVLAALLSAYEICRACALWEAERESPPDLQANANARRTS